jgi:hypothetical protein
MSITPQVNKGLNSAIAGGISGITGGNVNTYFNPTPQIFNPSPVNNATTAQALLGGGPLVLSGQTSLNSGAPKIATTSTGGVTFPTPSSTGGKLPLSSYINQNISTPNGGSATIGGGNVSNYTSPSNFSIKTGDIKSDALGSNVTTGDLSNKYQSLQGYVNALAQANGYSPDYLNAYQGYQQAQANQAGVGAALVSRAAPTLDSYLRNPSGFGDTMGYAQALNGQEQALASQQGMQQNIALNTQQLARTGNIAAAQAQLQYSPAAVSQQNALQQYNALQQAYPSANLPPVNPNGDLLAQLQSAHAQVAASPAYQAQFQSTYTTPAGGTGIYNKLNSGALQQNQDGTLQLISGAAAALGSAQQTALSQNISTYNQLAPAYKAANDDFTAMTQFMQQTGINDAKIPIMNQLENKVKSKLLDPGAIGAFQSYITSLRSNYANLLGTRGETPTQAGQDAASLVPDNLNAAQMQQVQQALNTNGGNILNATQSTIQSILGGISSGQTNGSMYNGNTSSGWGSLGD